MKQHATAVVVAVMLLSTVATTGVIASAKEGRSVKVASADTTPVAKSER